MVHNSHQDAEEVNHTYQIHSNKQIIVDGLSGAMAAFISAVVFFPFDNFITRCQNFESKKKEKKQEEKDNYKGDNSIALIHA